MTTKTKPTIDLTPFCEKSDHRYKLDVPFVRSGRRYATDKNICVRVPARGKPDTPLPNEFHLQYPRSETLAWWKGFRGTPELMPWPTGDALKEPYRAPCRNCDGTATGVASIRAKCPICKGTGFVDDYKRRVLTRWIAGRYERLIPTLPGVQVVKDGEDCKRPILFTFDGGGQGLVMPIYSPG